jgi:tungstate transport system ATP-binding protein
MNGMRAPSSILPLRLNDVTFEAGDRTIIERVTLDLTAGSRSVILGANGAGKSVLMRLMHGLLKPISGSVEWAQSNEARVRARQAMVFQRPVMLRRSALANIAYGLKIAGVPEPERSRRAHAALEHVALSHLAAGAARVLSGGEQQRLALARAWALIPEVLFLDEPTANLDPGATREVEAIITQIHASGTKIVMTTHNLGQAKRLGDEILFLNQGRLVERTPVDRFFHQPVSAEAAAFIRGELPWN